MIVSLLTDYGHEDEFVGVCHAVIRGIAPDVPIVDLTHGIARYGVREGAIVLRNSLPYVPVGVHVAIVDPQVGTERRGVAVRTDDGRALVGPDNGLLSLAWEACGGVIEAVDISRSPHRLEPVSATFHGRDLFAPVAAHLAAGAELADAGQHVEPDELQLLTLPEPRVGEGEVHAHVLLVDRFGNASLDVAHADLVREPEATARRVLAHCGLDYDLRVLAIGERGGSVSTASAAQVREGLRAPRAPDWEPYREQLAPLAAALAAAEGEGG